MGNLAYPCIHNTGVFHWVIRAWPINYLVDKLLGFTFIYEYLVYVVNCCCLVWLICGLEFWHFGIADPTPCFILGYAPLGGVLCVGHISSIYLVHLIFWNMQFWISQIWILIFMNKTPSIHNTVEGIHN